jgi:osmotically inducible protein OsmC
MPTRNAEAEWTGTVTEGSGTVKLGSGAFEGPYSFKSRFEDGSGTNPEELMGAAHAGCFSMALSLILTEGGHQPERIHTSAKVHLDQDGNGPTISKIELTCEAEVGDIDADHFLSHAEQAKETCPVSRALAGTEITLDARLLSGSAA